MIDYDPHKWHSHLWDIKGSLLREIAGRIVLIVLWACVVVAVHDHVRPVGVSSTVHSLVGVALGLLLVFRTNASYDRFWEGRKLWGGIINESRNLARLTRSALAEAPELRDGVIDWLVAFPYASMFNLRGQRGLGPVAGRIDAEDIELVMNSVHVPSAVAAQMTNRWFIAYRAQLITDIMLVTLDQYVKNLIDHVGACERIHKTPLPYVYVVHLRRAILIYCLTLPFALVHDFGWLAVVCTLLVSFILIGIEELGVEIEDPFGEDENDLPLERFCETVRSNLLGSHEHLGDLQSTTVFE